MTARQASCSCGQLRVFTDGEPVRVSVCHCLACQQRTGSAFGFQARFPREKVRIEGPSTAWKRTGDAGHVAEFHFCPTCGSTVWYAFEDMPQFVAVTVGAFADPGFPAPDFSVYEARRHAWVSVPPEAEHMD
jgi:hypothetical protein